MAGAPPPLLAFAGLNKRPAASMAAKRQRTETWSRFVATVPLTTTVEDLKKHLDQTDPEAFKKAVNLDPAGNPGFILIIEDHAVTFYFAVLPDVPLPSRAGVLWGLCD